MFLKITAVDGNGEHTVMNVEAVGSMTTPIKKCSLVDEKNNYVIKNMRNVDPRILALKMGCPVKA